MPYVPTSALVGAQPPSDLWVPSTDQNFPLGQPLVALDPYFGYGEFVYGKAFAAMGVGRIVTFNEVYTAGDVANTANTGSPIAFAAANMAANTYGWFRRGGGGPVAVNATVGIGAAIGVAAAGVAGANTAGKQILNARLLQNQTFAQVITACGLQSGDKRVFLKSTNGLFVGLAVTGTGIPGSTVIAGLDPSHNMITLNNAPTATAPTDLTFTWTGFSWVYADRPFVQGAIT